MQSPGTLTNTTVEQVDMPPLLQPYLKESCQRKTGTSWSCFSQGHGITSLYVRTLIIPLDLNQNCKPSIPIKINSTMNNRIGIEIGIIQRVHTFWYNLKSNFFKQLYQIIYFFKLTNYSHNRIQYFQENIQVVEVSLQHEFSDSFSKRSVIV